MFERVNDVIAREENDMAAGVMLYDLFTKAGNFDAFFKASESSRFGMYHSGRNMMVVLERLLNHLGSGGAPPTDVVRFALWFGLKELHDIGILAIVK